MIFYDGDPIRTRIARAVIERLAVLSRDSGGYLQAIEQAPIALEKVEQAAFQKAMHDLAGRAPAVVVVVDDELGFEAGGISQREWRRELDVLVYAISTHRRDLVAGREDPDAESAAGAQADPGLRAMVQEIGGLLSGHSLGLEDIGLLRPERLRGLWADAALTVWEWTFRVAYDQTSINAAAEPVTSVLVENTTAEEPPVLLAAEELP